MYSLMKVKSFSGVVKVKAENKISAQIMGSLKRQTKNTEFS